MRKYKTYLLCVIFIVLYFFVSAQNNFSVNKDKIISDVYFAIVSVYKGDTDKLCGFYKEYKKSDDALRRAGKASSGLSDNFFMVYISTIKNREEYLKNISLLLHSYPDDIVKNITKYNYLSDEIILSKRLYYEDNFNIFAGVFNYFSKVFSQVVLGNTQALAQIFVDAAFSFDILTKSTLRQRKTIVIIDDFLKKYPEYLQKNKLLTKKQILKKKRNNYLFNNYILVGDSYKKSDNLKEAAAYYQRARELLPDNQKVKKRILDVEKQISKRKRVSIKSLCVIDGESKLTEDEKKEYNELLTALTIDSPYKMFQVGKKYYECGKKNSLTDEALYLQSVSFDMLGKHDEADIYKEKNSIENPDSNVGSRCKTILNNKYLYNYVNFGNNLKKFNSETKHFIFTGSRPERDNLYLVSTGIVNQAESFLNAVGYFFVIDVGVRAIMVQFYNPISYDPLVKSGVLYLAQNPDSKKKDEIYSILAGKYTAAKQYDKAIAYYKKLPKSVENDKKINELYQKYVRRIYYFALENGTDKEKITSLRYVQEKFKDTKYAARAEESIKKIEEKGKSKIVKKKDVFAFEDLKKLPVLSSERKKLPLEVTGGIGSSGIEVYPGLQVYKYNAEDEPLYER